MSRVYTTSEVMAGSTKIKVRQVLLTGDRSAPQSIIAATLSARNWLQSVIPIRPSNAYEDTIASIFRFFFHEEPTPERTNIVWTVLNLIRQGLEQPFAVKISNTNPRTLGYVKGYWAACSERDGQIYMFDEDKNVMRRKGEIHLYRGMLQKTDITAITLIHEAGHRFANLKDFGNDGYFSEDYSGMESYTLPWGECMRNADSYAAFVYFLANPVFAQTLLTQRLLDSNQNRLALGFYG